MNDDVAAFDAFFLQAAFFGVIGNEFCGVFRVALGVSGGSDGIHYVASEFHFLMRPRDRNREL